MAWSGNGKDDTAKDVGGKKGNSGVGSGGGSGGKKAGNYSDAGYANKKETGYKAGSTTSVGGAGTGGGKRTNDSIGDILSKNPWAGAPKNPNLGTPNEDAQRDLYKGGARDIMDKSRRGALGNSPNPTDMSTAQVSYDGLPSVGQLLDSAMIAGSIASPGIGTVNTLRDIFSGAYDDTGRTKVGRAVDDAFGSTPSHQNGYARGPGGYNSNNDPTNSSGMSSGRDNGDEEMGVGQASRARSVAAQSGNSGDSPGTDILYGSGDDADYSNVRLRDRRKPYQSATDLLGI